jgi:hypothetical protein
MLKFQAAEEYVASYNSTADATDNTHITSDFNIVKKRFWFSTTR